MTDAGLKEVATLKRLRALDLGRCGNVTDAGLKELSALKELQSLDLAGCNKVSNEGVDQLNKTLPKLKVTGR